MRRAFADPDLHRVPAHLTLLPPRNVADTQRPAAWRHLRETASRTRPFRLTLGPAASFLPESPTLHLSVDDPEGALHGLVRALDSGPLGRERRWPFVPHVTLGNPLDPQRIEAGISLLTGSLGDWLVDRLWVLEHVSDQNGTRWVPGEDIPFAAPRVLGRGGLEWELRVRRSLDPAVAHLVGSTPSHSDALIVSAHDTRAHDTRTDDTKTDDANTTDARATDDDRAGDTAARGHTVDAEMVVAAVAGSLEGAAAQLHAVAVTAQWRGYGLDLQVLTAWCREAAAYGATVALADPRRVDPRLLGETGFTENGGSYVRVLPTPGR